MKVLITIILMHVLFLNQIQVAKTVLPLYYAWFINPCDSSKLIDISKNYLKEIISIPEFKENYKKFNITNYEELTSYYIKCNRILHCTAYFCGHGSTPDCQTYHDNKEVQDAIKCPYFIKVIGLTITPRTFGYRIELTEDQKEIYNQNDKEDPTKSKRSVKKRSLCSSLSSYLPQSYCCGKNGDPKEWEKGFNNSCVNTVHKTISHKQDIDYHPVKGKGSRAHLTICTAKGISAVTTGFDVISAVKEEQQNPDYCKTASFKVTNGAVCRINKTDDIWVVYFRTPLLTLSVFSDLDF